MDLATRPPCRDGYVRLVDLQPLALDVSVVLTLAALVLLWRARRGKHLKLIAAISIVVFLCVGLVDLTAFGTLVDHHGSRYDDTCWTF